MAQEKIIKKLEKEFDETFKDCKEHGFPLTTKSRLKWFIRWSFEAGQKDQKRRAKRVT